MVTKKRKDEETEEEVTEEQQAPPPGGGLEMPHPDAVAGAEKPEDVQAIGKVARDFLGNLPPTAAASGHHTFPEPSEDAEELPVEDGKYRVAGSEWIFVFEDGHPREAIIARPPDFGGEDVKSVEI